MPRKSLSPARILTEAVQLADEVGLDGVTMRALAKRLGVKAMSLYGHIANKEALLDGMTETVMEKIPLPPLGTPWKEALRQRQFSAHQVLTTHPWACPLVMSRPTTGPARLRWIEHTLGYLYAAGFDDQTVDQAWNALDSHLYGFTIQQINFPHDTSDIPEVVEDYLEHMQGQPHMLRMASAIMTSDYDGVPTLDFGLELLLDALERRLPQHTGASAKGSTAKN